MSTPELKPAENGFYYAYWSDGRRSKRKSMGSKDPAIAEKRFAHWLLLGGHKGEISEDLKSSLTVGELWPLYYAGRVVKTNVNPKLADNSWSNLEPHFAGLTLPEIDQDCVDEYLKLRCAGKIGRRSVPSTVRRELAILRACLNWCADPKRKPKLINRVDVPQFELPEESPARERWLTTDEIAALFASAQKLHSGANRMSRGERFLWLGLETAARERAICELKWDRVDFEIGKIHFATPGARKSKKRRVSVAISDTLRPVLERMHAERVNDYVLDHPGKVWATIQIIVERSGIVPPRTEKRKAGGKPKSTGISPHTLRHTAATQMARRGVPLFDIAGVLGNTFAMVEKVYAKHCPDSLRAAVNSISGPMREAAE